MNLPKLLLMSMGRLHEHKPLKMYIELCFFFYMVIFWRSIQSIYKILKSIHNLKKVKNTTLQEKSPLGDRTTSPYSAPSHPPWMISTHVKLTSSLMPGSHLPVPRCILCRSLQVTMTNFSSELLAFMS